MWCKTCPICGVQVADGLSLIAYPGIQADRQHRCAEKTLCGIDATMGVEERKPREPSYGQRLAYGFILAGED
jgi:hypothetical protein